MNRDDLDQTYEKWKRCIVRADIYIMALILLTEIASYFIMKKAGLIFDTVRFFMIRYVAAPSLFNAAVIVTGLLLLRTRRFAGRRGDYIPLIQMLLLCTSAAITHHIFTILAGSLCFPVFVSVVYDRPRITRNVWLLTYPALLAVYAERKYAEIVFGTESPYLIMDTFVAAALTLAAYLTCREVVKYQAEKRQIIDEMHRYELELREELNRESKTGLYNYGAFQNKLYRETEKSRFTRWRLLLVIMDIDHFKWVNDTYGHAQGDIVLKRLADLLKKYFKTEEFPTRYGGEEFTAIIREDTLEELTERIEKIREEFSAQEYGFMDERLTLSAGIAQWKPGMTDKNLFDCADKALYRAKEEGRDQIVIWTGEGEKYDGFI